MVHNGVRVRVKVRVRITVRVTIRRGVLPTTSHSSFYSLDGR